MSSPNSIPMGEVLGMRKETFNANYVLAGHPILAQNLVDVS